MRKKRSISKSNISEYHILKGDPRTKKKGILRGSKTAANLTSINQSSKNRRLLTTQNESTLIAKNKTHKIGKKRKKSCSKFGFVGNLVHNISKSKSRDKNDLNKKTKKFFIENKNWKIFQTEGSVKTSYKNDNEEESENVKILKEIKMMKKKLEKLEKEKESEIRVRNI